MQGSAPCREERNVLELRKFVLLLHIGRNLCRPPFVPQ